ncbi:MAG: TolC family protein [Bacteroidota bacterium]
MNRRVAIFLIVFLTGWTSSIVAQSDNPTTLPDTITSDTPSESPTALSVQKALELALQRNPQLKQRMQEYKRMEGEQKLSLGISNPEIYYMKEGINGSNFSEQRWAISQSLPFPLESIQQHKRYNRKLASVQSAIEAERLRIKADVKRAYTDLSYAIELYHLTQEQVGLANELLETAQLRLDVGETTRFDVLQAEIQLAEANNDRADAQKMIQRSRYELFNVIGLEPEQQVYDITFPDTLRYVHYDIKQEEVLNKIDTHPLLMTESHQQEATQWNFKSARNSWMPDLRIDYYRQEIPGGNQSGFDFQGFEVGLQIPLWFFNNERGNIQQARASMKQQSWRTLETELQVKKQAEQAWHSYQTSKQTIDRYRSTIQSQSKQLLSLTQEGYQAGEMDLLSLLQAQRTYLDSQRRYLSALRDYYMQLIALEHLLQQNLVFNTNQASQ